VLAEQEGENAGDDQRAVQEGLALTGRVVTAAAAIMVCVFLSFMLGEDRIIKEFGLSLASAVFLDALVIRCLLLPAVLTLSYRQCATPPATGATIVYLQSLLGELLEILPAKLDLGLHSISAPIWHFSVYAVADRAR